MQVNVCPPERLELQRFGCFRASLLGLFLLLSPLLISAQEWQSGQWRGREVQYRIIDGQPVAEGDILLDNIDAGESKSARRDSVAINGSRYMWPNGVVPYVLDAGFPNQSRVLTAIDHWQELTPLRFVQRTNEANYVQFFASADGCSSNIGMIGGRQRINLGSECTRGAVIHEIGHAVGLFHEQSRHDRDFHIRLVRSNLDIRELSNFTQELTSGRDLGGYDYGSVMHYDAFAFSRNENPTLQTIPAGIPISQRDRLSPEDIDSVKRLYGMPINGVTISTFPFELQVEVDGQVVTAPQVFQWAPGSRHTLSVRESTSGGIRYQFGRWSDGGEQTHTITVTPDVSVYTANMVKQVRLPVSSSPAAGGRVEVTPSSADGYYTEGTELTLRPVPNAGYYFRDWGGTSYFSFHGDSPNPLKAYVEEGLRYVANFSQAPVTTIDTGVPGLKVKVDGREVTTPKGFTWAAGTTHTVLVEDTTQTTGYETARHIYEGEPTIQVTATAESSTVRVPFRTQHLLVRTSSQGGQVQLSPASDGNFYDAGSTVQVTAIPSSAYRFTSWTGDASGSDAVTSILMNDYKSFSPTFAMPRQIGPTAIVNGANFMGTGAVAPGQIVTIFGLEIGPAELTTLALNNGRVSTQLANTAVYFDEIAAPLIYAGKDYVSAVVPYAVGGRSFTNVRVQSGGQSSNTRSVAVVPAAPALFTANSSGRGPAAALNQNGSYNNEQNPAPRGSVVVLYGTGEGETMPAGVDGKPGQAPLPRPRLPIKVKIAGRDAVVHYAGAAPGYTAGALQVNVQIPDDCPSGAVPVVLQAGEYSSLANVSIFVQ